VLTLPRWAARPRAHQAPKAHYTEQRLTDTVPLQQQGAWNFEDGEADVEGAGGKANGRFIERQLLHELQFGKADIEPVNDREHVAEH
jgi:hypothetical protein